MLGWGTGKPSESDALVSGAPFSEPHFLEPHFPAPESSGPKTTEETPLANAAENRAHLWEPLYSAYRLSRILCSPAQVRAVNHPRARASVWEGSLGARVP